MSAPRHSALYEGRVWHHRRAPRPHAFAYGLHLLYLDLDELPSLRLGPLFGVERRRPVAFRRRDYLGAPDTPLAEAVRERVRAALGEAPAGPVRMLTHVRTLGYVFNPVTFYYCFERDGRLGALVAEITNTPWGERHAYVLRAAEGRVESTFDKAFHVSPFFPMTQRYTWRFDTPGSSLRVEMRNEEAGREVFSAGLALTRRPLTAASLLGACARRPLLTATVHAAIYWQALRLWLRRTPFFTHPARVPLARVAPRA